MFCGCCVCEKDEELTGWRVKRNIDGLDKGDFVFDSIVIAPISKIRVSSTRTTLTLSYDERGYDQIMIKVRNGSVKVCKGMNNTSKSMIKIC